MRRRAIATRVWLSKVGSPLDINVSNYRFISESLTFKVLENRSYVNSWHNLKYWDIILNNYLCMLISLIVISECLILILKSLNKWPRWANDWADYWTTNIFESWSFLISRHFQSWAWPSSARPEFQMICLLYHEPRPVFPKAASSDDEGFPRHVLPPCPVTCHFSPPTDQRGGELCGTWEWLEMRWRSSGRGQLSSTGQSGSSNCYQVWGQRSPDWTAWSWRARQGIRTWWGRPAWEAPTALTQQAFSESGVLGNSLPFPDSYGPGSRRDHRELPWFQARLSGDDWSGHWLQEKGGGQGEVTCPTLSHQKYLRPLPL